MESLKPLEFLGFVVIGAHAINVATIASVHQSNDALILTFTHGTSLSLVESQEIADWTHYLQQVARAGEAQLRQARLEQSGLVAPR